MESRKRDGPGDLSFFLDILAVAETTRRLARVAIALAIKAGAPDRTPTQAELARRIVTAGIPELLADAESAGIPADELTTAAIEAWARGMDRDEKTRAVLEGPWNHREDVPQWMEDGTSFADRILGNRRS